MFPFGSFPNSSPKIVELKGEESRKGKINETNVHQEEGLQVNP